MGKSYKQIKVKKRIISPKIAQKNEYLFSLKYIRGSGDTEQFCVDYRCGFEGRQEEIKKCYPTYLNDKNHKTPGFVVPLLFQNFPQTQQFSNQSFHFSQSNIDCPKLFSVAKPADIHGICKLYYLAHIGTTRHAHNIMLAPYNEKIKEFCEQKYGRQKKLGGSEQDSTQILKEQDIEDSSRS